MHKVPYYVISFVLLFADLYVLLYAGFFWRQMIETHLKCI